MIHHPLYKPVSRLVLEYMVNHCAAETKREQAVKAAEQAQWLRILWAKVERNVRALQARIVEAVKQGRWNKVKSLQWILTHSYAGRLLAIRKVTRNKGSATSGIDGKVWKSPKQKMKAVALLKRHGYKSEPLRRVKIPKQKGGFRNLGIPTMLDRAMQALYALALDPVSETLADVNSYGFRRYRATHDAISRLFSLLSKQNAPRWILEADIKGCFDNISHRWLHQNICLDKQVLNSWLKSGVVSNNQLFATEKGTPQGGVISPILANMTLDGLAQAIDKCLGIKTWGKVNKRRVNNPHQVHLVRYADDFVVTANNKTVLEQEVKPTIEAFLAQRGLSLSAKKTQITSIDTGFDFLGQNLRKYKGKLLIKPAKSSVKRLLEKIRQMTKTYKGKPASLMLYRINAALKGWCMYHRHVVSKATFQMIDHRVFETLWRWCRKRHPKKSSAWLKRQYFKRRGTYNWMFQVQDEKRGHLTIFKCASVKIERHVKIRDTANPYDRNQELYFEKRNDYQTLQHYHGRYTLTRLYNAQKGLCPLCQLKINKQTGWNIHHRQPLYLGGTNNMSNLVLLHPTCHTQVHESIRINEINALNGWSI